MSIALNVSFGDHVRGDRHLATFLEPRCGCGSLRLALDRKRAHCDECRRGKRSGEVWPPVKEEECGRSKENDRSHPPTRRPPCIPSDPDARGECQRRPKHWLACAASEDRLRRLGGARNR